MVTACVSTAVGAVGVFGATVLTGGLALPAILPTVLALGGTGVSVAGSLTNIGAIVVGKLLETAKYKKAAKLWDKFTTELRNSKILEPLLQELLVDGLALKDHGTAVLAVSKGIVQLLDDGILVAKDIVKSLPILRLAFIGGTLAELLYLLIALDSRSPGKHLRTFVTYINSLIKALEIQELKTLGENMLSKSRHYI